MYQRTVSVLGIHTFYIYDCKSDDAGLDRMCYAFDGRDWCIFDDVREAAAHLQDVQSRVYQNSMRAIPTGFGMVADYETGELFFHVCFNGRIEHIEHVSYEPMLYQQLGLTSKAIAADQQAMRVACGY